MTVIERASRYIASMPPAISGSGGDKATFIVAEKLRHGFDLTEEEAWPIMLKYNERCEPPWSEKELRHKLADAGRLDHHHMPRGYVRSAGTRSANPAKPAKLPSLRAIPWKDRIPKGIAKQEIQAPAAPPPGTHPSGATDEQPDIIQMFLRTFNGQIVPDDDADPEVWSQIDTIETILNQRDVKGRISYTRSQVDSCFIGLRGLAGTHPAVDAMLARLEKAKKSALTWTSLAARMQANG